MLPETLLCPDTQNDNIFKLKKVPVDKRAYFSSLAHNFLARRGRTEETDRGGTVAREPTAVALKWLNSHKRHML